MTEKRPRAPALLDGTCIATAALMESAQRVFIHRSRSPIHWVDLCTFIEAILLHEKIAFPVVHDGYAEPLLKPLIDSGVADMWWPQAGILKIANEPKDQSTDREEKTGDDLDHRDASEAVRIFVDEPDERYERLSASRRTAINGIAHGFAETALLMKNDEITASNTLQVLLWGGWRTRFSDHPGFEDAAVSLMKEAMHNFTTSSPTERAAYTVPHRCSQDVYNHYAKNLRDLGNDAQATIVKSLVEEPFFDAVSVESAVRDTLGAILEKSYDSKVAGLVGKYCTVIPSSPFGGIVLSKATNINDVINIALDLRDSFASYRTLRKTYRDTYKEFLKAKTLALAQELEDIEKTFEQAMDYSFKHLENRRAWRSFDVAQSRWRQTVFDGIKGVQNLLSGDLKKIFGSFSDNIVALLREWSFMNYGGVYQVVSKFPKIEQLSATSERLVGKKMDKAITAVLRDAAKTFQTSYNLNNTTSGIAE